MTPQERVRDRGTTAAAQTVVAVTGAAAPVGRAFCAHLVQDGRVGRVVAIDSRRGDVTGPTWRVVDLRDPVLARRLARVDVLVHLAVEPRPDGDPEMRRRHNVEGTRAVLDAAAEAGVGRVVVVSSAVVYGASPDNPVPLAEDAPLRAVPDSSLVGDLLAIEDHVAEVQRAHPELAVCVVRPALLAGPGTDSVLTRHFEAPRLLVVREARACWQFCHVDDLVSALEVAALTDVEGPLTVGCDGWLDPAEVERISGRRRLELPSAVAFRTAERLHRLGVTPAPATELAYTVHPWVVPSTRLREAGWRPSHDNRSALRALLAESEGRTAIGARRLGRADATATLGAAGATAAVLGAAALVRRARRRRLGG